MRQLEQRWQHRLARPAWTWLLTAFVTLGVIGLLKHFTHSSTVAFAGANVWEVADWICMESLDILTNVMEVASYANTDQQAEFERDYPVGDTVRVPLPVQGIIRNGLGYTGQAVTNKHTTVTADQVFGMDFDYDSIEQALRMGKSKDWISKRILEPFMVKIAQEWDSRFARFVALNTPNYTGVLGTDPTNFDGTTTAARQQIVELGGWQDDAGAFLPPSVMRNLRTNFATAFNPQTDMSKAFHTGLYGRADKFDMHESMSLLSFTSGTWASPTGITVKTAVADGDTTLVVNCTTSDVFNQGDLLTLPSSFRVNAVTKQKIGARACTVVVTATTVGASSAATLPIAIGPYGFQGPGNPYQNVDVLPAVNDVVTPFSGTTFTANTAKTGTQALAFNKRAAMLIGIPLRVPKSAEQAAQKRDENTGIAVRFTSTWDAVLSRFINRLDTVGGFGVGNTDACSVRILCAA